MAVSSYERVQSYVEGPVTSPVTAGRTPGACAAAAPSTTHCTTARRCSRDDCVDVTSRLLLSASRPHLRSTWIGAPARGPECLSPHPAQHESSTLRVRGERSWSTSEMRMRGRSRSRRCRELLGEGTETMTDQEVALIRRHAETI